MHPVSLPDPSCSIGLSVEKSETAQLAIFFAGTDSDGHAASGPGASDQRHLSD
jgi:hypothetical protein